MEIIKNFLIRLFAVSRIFTTICGIVMFNFTFMYLNDAEPWLPMAIASAAFLLPEISIITLAFLFNIKQKDINNAINKYDNKFNIIAGLVAAGVAGAGAMNNMPTKNLLFLISTIILIAVVFNLAKCFTQEQEKSIETHADNGGFDVSMFRKLSREKEEHKNNEN